MKQRGKNNWSPIPKDPSLRILKRELQVTKSLKCDNISNCVYTLNRNTYAKFQLPSVFQS